MTAPRKFVLEHWRSPGDIVVMTALVRDLALAYPEQLAVGVRTFHNEIWKNNPYLTHIPNKASNVERFLLRYKPDIQLSRKGSGQHFLTAFHQAFTRQTGLEVPLSHPWPDLHLSAQEEAQRPLEGPYWVLVAGGKADVTIKHWDFGRYQQLVDELTARGLTVVQCGASLPGHTHAALHGTVNRVGQTNLRQFMQLIRHAQGVICPITAAMHIAAAFHKPCVVIAGGREEPTWEWYGGPFDNLGGVGNQIRVPHRFLHTMGQLPCCQTVGCWRSRLAPQNPGDRKLCERVVQLNGQPLAACMEMISVAQVVEAVISYDGTLGQDCQETPTKKHLCVLTKPHSQILQLPTSVQVRPTLKDMRSMPPANSSFDDVSLWDNPIIGGKLTVCALLYGDYHELHRRCLESILATVPASRLDLRVGGNQLCRRTLDWLPGLPITKGYLHPENDYKYPVMREMFHDPDQPILTKYLVWFDDDTHAHDPQWVSKLCQLIIDQHPRGGRLYGKKMFHDLRNYTHPGYNPRTWFEQGKWWKGVPLQFRNPQLKGPNGSCIPFAAGWFWAMATELIQAADIPDRRLEHNGGDVTLGAQVHQQGMSVVDFNHDKEHVSCPSKENGGRRGFSQTFAWSTPAWKSSTLTEA